jgi:CRP-like cAMP-binding protein
MPSAGRALSAPQPSANWLLRVPAAEYEHLRPHLQAVPLRPGAFFLPASEPLTHVYFLQSGLVSLIVTMRSGDTVEVATVGREGMLGVSLLLEADPPPYDMVCHVPGEALRLSATAFQSVMHELPNFRRLLLRYTLCLFHEVARTAACNRLHTVEQRLARWLLVCSDKVLADVYPLTHESLAHMLGARRPFITQTARSLQAEGLIQYHRGTLRILNRAGLEALSCEDYRATQQEYTRLLA